MQERPRTDGLKAAGQRGLQRRIHKTQCGTEVGSKCVSLKPTPPRPPEQTQTTCWFSVQFTPPYMSSSIPVEDTSRIRNSQHAKK
eukprot:scaffold76005_cov17-Tisochrysis_lutea.AAC.2